MKRLTKEQRLKNELDNLLRENKIYASLFTDKAYEQLLTNYKKNGFSAVKNFMKTHFITPKNQVFLVATDDNNNLEVHTTESIGIRISKTKDIIAGKTTNFTDEQENVVQQIK